MERSGEIYARLLGRLEETLPELAEEVRTTVDRGHFVQGGKLTPDERRAVSSKIAGLSGAKFGTNEGLTVRYSDDERLRLLLEAIRTLSRSMYSNRRRLAAFLAERSGSTDVAFVDPAEVDGDLSFDEVAEGDQSPQGRRERFVSLNLTESIDRLQARDLAIHELLVGAEGELGVVRDRG